MAELDREGFDFAAQTGRTGLEVKKRVVAILQLARTSDHVGAQSATALRIRPRSLSVA